jgi:hypothetical protein
MLERFEEYGELPQHPNAQAILNARRPPLAKLPQVKLVPVGGSGQWLDSVTGYLARKGLSQEVGEAALSLLFDPGFNATFSVVVEQ